MSRNPTQILAEYLGSAPKCDHENTRKDTKTRRIALSWITSHSARPRESGDPGFFRIADDRGGSGRVEFSNNPNSWVPALSASRRNFVVAGMSMSCVPWLPAR